MAGLKCPLCGTVTSPTLYTFRAESDVEWAGFLAAGLLRQKTLVSAITPEGAGGPTYGVIVCQDCQGRFVAKKKGWPAEKKDWGTWEAVYPIPKTAVAGEIPELIRSEFEEAHLCLAVGAYRACLWMAREALIQMQREQRVSGLQELKEKGCISEMLYQQANEVRLWANVLHGDIPSDAVTAKEAEEVLLYLSNLLDTLYVQPKRLAAMTEKRAQLNGKRSSTTEQ